MAIIEDNSEYQIIETVTPNGKTVQTIYKPGSQGAIRDEILAKIEVAIATNIAALALPDPTPGNNTYLALAAIPAGTLTAAQLGTALRPVRLQVDALTHQNNALRDQVVALTRQVTALERHIAGRLDDVSGT